MIWVEPCFDLKFMGTFQIGDTGNYLSWVFCAMPEYTSQRPRPMSVNSEFIAAALREQKKSVAFLAAGGQYAEALSNCDPFLTASETLRHIFRWTNHCGAELGAQDQTFAPTAVADKVAYIRHRVPKITSPLFRPRVKRCGVRLCLWYKNRSPKVSNYGGLDRRWTSIILAIWALLN